MREFTFTDIALDTKRLLPTTEMLPTAPTGPNLLIQKPSTSSSENNPTGIVHLAHCTTQVPQLTLLRTRTPESTSTRLQDGKHQPSSGKTRLRELHITDTAHLTERLCTTPELFHNALNGLETLIQTLDGSSSEDNPTGIAHHVHHHTEEPTPPELLKIRELESQSTSSDHSTKLDG